MRAWVRGRRRAASFSVRFAVVLAVLGALIAGATAAIPIQLAAGDARNVALDRAADKGGIALNLVTGQRAALHTFASGVAGQLEGPLAAGDPATVAAILARQSAATDGRDVLG